jgi:citrate lyase subunit beta / citryl-CoA lyase
VFLPVDRPERFEKAINSGADAVIVDLEDAARVDQKDATRENARAFASAERGGSARLVRVNDPATLPAGLISRR